jgi:hypothetical protein
MSNGDAVAVPVATAATIVTTFAVVQLAVITEEIVAAPLLTVVPPVIAQLAAPETSVQPLEKFPVKPDMPLIAIPLAKVAFAAHVPTSVTSSSVAVSEAVTVQGAGRSAATTA